VTTIPPPAERPLRELVLDLIPADGSLVLVDAIIRDVGRKPLEVWPTIAMLAAGGEIESRTDGSLFTWVRRRALPPDPTT